MTITCEEKVHITIFIHLFIKYVLGISYVPDPILDSESTEVQKTEQLSVLVGHTLKCRDGWIVKK